MTKKCSCGACFEWLLNYLIKREICSAVSSVECLATVPRSLKISQRKSHRHHRQPVVSVPKPVLVQKRGEIYQLKIAQRSARKRKKTPSKLHPAVPEYPQSVQSFVIFLPDRTAIVHHRREGTPSVQEVPGHRSHVAARRRIEQVSWVQAMQSKTKPGRR